jgi:hypothetical protein
MEFAVCLCLLLILFICLTSFKNIPSKFSITFDAWTSKAYDPYLAITAHYINASPDQPLEWELKSKLLGFEELQGSYSGANVAVKIVEVLDQYNIRDKVSFISGFNINSLICSLAWLGNS